jgi:hypothetical protein
VRVVGSQRRIGDDIGWRDDRVTGTDVQAQLDPCASDGRIHADADTAVQVTLADRARSSGVDQVHHAVFDGRLGGGELYRTQSASASVASTVTRLGRQVLPIVGGRMAAISTELPREVAVAGGLHGLPVHREHPEQGQVSLPIGRSLR